MPSAHTTLLALAALDVPDALMGLAEGAAEILLTSAKEAGVIVSADVLWAIVSGGAMQRTLAGMIANDQIHGLREALPLLRVLPPVEVDLDEPTLAEQIVLLGGVVLARRILAGDL